MVGSVLQARKSDRLVIKQGTRGGEHTCEGPFFHENKAECTYAKKKDEIRIFSCEETAWIWKIFIYRQSIVINMFSVPMYD